MEFFATADIRLPATELQRHLRIATLPDYCASISKVLGSDGDKGNIYCVWGEFRVHREVIREGVRFTLPGCPNALQWSITAEGKSPNNHVVVHATINRREHAPEFVESVQTFVADWRTGLEAGLVRTGANSAGPGECMPWYG